MRRILLFSLLLIVMQAAAQQNVKKYSFEKKKSEVYEPAGTKDSIFQIAINANSLPTGTAIDSLKIVALREGEATSHDYSIPDSLSFFIHHGSQRKFDFDLHVKHDTRDDSDEDIILVLEYHVRNATNDADSSVTDTTTVIIKELSKSSVEDISKQKIAELQNSVYTNSFVLHVLHDTSYKVSIRDTADGHQMKICKIKENDIAKDTCREIWMKQDVDEAEFLFHFKRLLSKVGTIDSVKEGGITRTDKTASRTYLEWKNFLDNKKQKIANIKEMSEDAKKYNALEDSILKKVNVLLQHADTSYSYIGSTLKNIQLYRRHVEKVPYPTKGLIDPLSTPYDYIEYTAAEGSIVDFDSIVIRIDNGFLERIILSPSHDAKINYGFNDHTTIRKYYDLRNTTDVADIMNMYLPVESKRAYVNIVPHDDSLKPGRLYKPKGFKDYKSRDNPRYYYYSTYFVRLGDVLQYNPNPDSLPDVIRHVRNINLTFRLNQTDKIRLREKDFNSFSQLNIYTDLIGLSEDKPNGLIQAEGKFETGIFSQPLWNKSYYSKVKVKLLPSAYAAFTITKVENKLRYYLVPKDSTILYNEPSKKFDDTASRRRYIRNTDVQQYSSFLLNARFNLISVESDFAQVKLYIEGGIIRTAVNDTTNGTDNLGNPIVHDSKTVLNSLKTAWGIAIKLKSNSRLGVDFGIEWQRSTLNNNLLTQVYTSYNKEKRKEELKESVYRYFPSFRPQMIIPNVNIYYFLDRDFQNRLYLRGKYYKDLRSRSDNLLFVQFGYSTDLKGFFGLFKKTE